MKILFHGWEYPPNGGGVGAYMRNMAQALAQSGHQAVVLCGRSDGLPEESVESGVLVLRCYDRSEVNSERVARRVLDVANAHHVDWIEGADHLGECAGLLDLKQRPPILIKAHACQILRVLQRAQEHYPWQRLTIALALMRIRKQLRAERKVLERADVLLSPSARLLEELNRQGLRLPSRQGVLPNPISVDAAVVGTESVRPTMVFVGRLEFLKGVAYLPGILRAVRRVIPDVMLEIVGGDTYARGIGSIQSWLKRQFVDQSGSVNFCGRLRGAALEDAYRRAWVVVHPSLWDNFPTVVLEAMAAGRAVVSTPHGGMVEMLDGTGCPIADPRGGGFEEAVLALMQDAPRRQRVASGAHLRVTKEYNPASVVKEYVNVLGRV